MSVTHATAADGTFSTAGAIAWDENHVVASGTDKEVLFNDAGTVTGAGGDLKWDKTVHHLEIGEASGDGALCLFPVTAEPVVETGELILYSKNIGGRIMPKWLGPSGIDTPFQPFIGMNRMSQWLAQNASATLLAMGYAVPTATGTATVVTNAMTSIYLQMQRVEALVTTAAATAVAGFRGATANWFLGNVAGCGGFYFVMRGGPATGVATASHRFYMGMSASTAAPTDVEPSTIANSIGLGYDAADANLQIIARNASAVTKTPLTTSNGTVNSAIPSADRSKMFELVLFAKANDTAVSWRVTDIVTGDQWKGTAAAGTGPVAATKLAPRIWASAGGTSSVIGIALSSMYLETDY